MRKTPTYKEQFDKLTRAYINGDVRPWYACACFIGNLLNNKGAWISGRKCNDAFEVKEIDYYADTFEAEDFREALNVIRQESNGLYKPEEIFRVEKSFLETFKPIHPQCWHSSIYLDENDWICGDAPRVTDNPEYEDYLFLAFSKALDALRELHLSKGEVIDEVPVFVKRTLQPA